MYHTKYLRRTHRALVHLGGAAIFAFVMLVGQGFAQSGGNDTGPLVVGLWTEPTSVDPGVELNVASAKSVIDNVYEALVAYEGDSLEVSPRLAESWDVSDDGLEYRFSLRRDVRFHDGSRFDAQAVLATIERVQSLGATPASLIAGLESASALDDYTVEFRLAAPNAFFVDQLAWIYIVSPEAVAQHAGEDSGKTWFARNAVGTGPYRLVRWDAGQLLLLERFDAYWRGWQNDHVGTVALRVITESGTQRLLLERGDLDIAQVVSIDSVPALRQNPRIRVLEDPGLSQFQLMLNTVNPPLDDVRVRKAVEYAFDYEGHNEGAMRGFVERATTPFPAEMVGGLPGVAIYDYDPDLARSLLADAGYADGDITLEYRYISGFTEQRAAGEILQASLAPLGIKVEISEAPWPTLLQLLQDPSTAYDVWAFYVQPRTNNPMEFLTNLFATWTQGTNGRNFSYFSDPRVDELLTQAPAMRDPEARAQAFAEAAKIIAEAAVAVPINRAVSLQAMGTWVQGYVANPLKPLMLDFYSLSIEGR